MNKVLRKRALAVEIWKQKAISAATLLHNSTVCKVNTVLCANFRTAVFVTFET